MCLPIDRHLVFFHCLEQCALRFWCRPIYFVGEYELSEDGPRLKLEVAFSLLKYRDADDVSRQKIARKLNSLKTQTQNAGKGLREHGLSQAGKILDEQMTAGKQAGQAQGYFIVFAEDNGAERLARFIYGALLAIRAQGQLFECISALHRLLQDQAQ
jgi:hypothetical protein